MSKPRGGRMGVLVSPNQLTVLRMAVVPVLILLIVYGYVGWALLTFVVAGLTEDSSYV